ncbi:MAG TPA: AI-2E family transporter [Chitinophagaceae bacterium]|nr:AI-2E family transporter [Chitinophagaceae bacterium]
MVHFNDRLKQIVLLSLLIFFVFLAIRELRAFLPGLLGALTLYILSRGDYFQLVYNRKWKKGRAAGLFIVYYLLILGVPIFLAVLLISPKIDAFLKDPSGMINDAKTSIEAMQRKFGLNLISHESLENSLSQVTAFIPRIINSTANIVANLGLMLFILYFMFYNGKELERFLNRIIPLKQENIQTLATSTKKMIKANALGIPLISIIQGLTATLGYFIFGVKEWGLWGFVTGVFAFFPIVGTMIVWVPLVVYMFATAQSWQAVGLLIYSVVITGQVDYLARITLLRRIGNVHPVMTVLGVIIGLGLFGFIGLIFGPLLVNYIVVLFDIYVNEFVDPDAPRLQTEATSIPEEEEKKEPPS